MTEHSKIPLPGTPDKKAASSVERAIKGFDLARIGGIAAPLPPTPQRRVVLRPHPSRPRPRQFRSRPPSR